MRSTRIHKAQSTERRFLAYKDGVMAELPQLDLATPIQPRTAGCPIPLTAAQRRIWIGTLDRTGQRLSARVCAHAVRIVGPLHPLLLQKSIEALIHRHESLRIRVVITDGIPLQEVTEPADYALNVVDLSNLASNDAEQQVLRLAQDFIDERIDLLAGPLFEARMWRLKVSEYVLVLMIDHIVSDGVSHGILTRELWDFYSLLARREVPSPANLPIQFSDYAVWQAQTERSWLDEHAEYWRQHMRDVRPTVLLPDPGLSSAEAGTRAAMNVSFGEALTTDLRQAARRERALLSMFILTAFTIAVSKWCRRHDFLICLPSSGRHRPGLQNVVGFIANFLYLRVRMSPNESLRDLLRKITLEASSAFRHWDFDRVPDLVSGCTSEVSFNWQATHSRGGALDHHVVLECADFLQRSSERQPTPGHYAQKEKEELQILPFRARTPPGGSKFFSMIFDTPSSLHLATVFRPDYLLPSTVQRFANDLQWVSQEFARNPMSSVGTVLAHLQDYPSAEVRGATGRR